MEIMTKIMASQINEKWIQTYLKHEQELFFT
jgi:hypothetical protein